MTNSGVLFLGVTIVKEPSRIYPPEWMNSRSEYLSMAGSEQRLSGQFHKDLEMTRMSISSHHNQLPAY